MAKRPTRISIRHVWQPTADIDHRESLHFSPSDKQSPNLFLPFFLSHSHSTYQILLLSIGVVVLIQQPVSVFQTRQAIKRRQSWSRILEQNIRRNKRSRNLENKKKEFSRGGDGALTSRRQHLSVIDNNTLITWLSKWRRTKPQIPSTGM